MARWPKLLPPFCRGRSARTKPRLPLGRCRPRAEVLEERVLLTTYTVTNTGDLGGGSLRFAIQSANANPGPDIIDFNIPGSGVQTITLLSALPQITDPVIIDGTSQPGYRNKPLIELDGHKAGSGVDGLDVAAGNSTVEGLAVDRFSGSGIVLMTAGGDLLAANYVGTDPQGGTLLPNLVANVVVQTANNTIGGPGQSQGNLLSGGSPIGLELSGAGATANLVIGNDIGTDASGLRALSNLSDGVLLTGGASLNTIGGAAGGDTNLISGNGQAGVHVTGSSTTGNLIIGNYIGTERTGTGPIPNGTDGVLIDQGASNNTVGGLSGQGNILAFNTQAGVAVQGAATVGIPIRGNSMFGNGVLGIDLGNTGVQTNHLGSTTGPNNLQNYPVLTAVNDIGATTVISGSLRGAPGTTYTLDFYDSPSPDVTYYGEGKIYLGSAVATTDASGYVLFTRTLSARTTNGDWISATATDPSSDTSELCGSIQVPATPFTLSTTNWQSIGPSPVAMSPETFPMIAGRIEAVAPDPSNSNIMYVAGRGGVFKTTDWLDPSPIWVPLTDSQSSTFVNNRSYSGLAVFAAAPNTVFVAVSGPGGGVLESTDGGATWTLLGNSVFDQAELGAIVVDPNNVNSIYVAAWAGAADFGGVYHSGDGGATWTNLTSGFHQGGCSALVMDPTNSATLYAGLVPYIGDHSDVSSSGLYKSTDGGNSWTLLSPGNLTGTSVGQIIRVVIAPSSPQTLYTTIFDPSLGSLPDGLPHRFVSTDGGSTWTALKALPTAEDGRYAHVALAVDPSNAQTIYANGQNTFYRSTDGGSTWTLLDSYEQPAGVSFDDTGAFVMAGIYGLYRQAAPSLALAGKQGNLTNLEMESLTLDPTDPTIAYGIALNQFAALKYTDYPVWTVLGQPANSTYGVGERGKILVDPTNPARLYDYTPANLHSLVERSDDGGVSWTDVSNGLPVNLWAGYTTADFTHRAFTMDPSNHDRLLLGLDRVYQSTNDAGSWSAISPVLSVDGLVVALAIAPSDPNTIYASTSDGKVFWTQNGGTSWQEVDSGLSVQNFNQIVDFEIDPANAKHVFIVPGPLYPEWISGPAHVWTTTDPASGWSEITGNLNTENWTDTLVVDWRYSTPVLYVGTERGVYQSADTGAHWNLFGQGLPNVPVTDLQFLPARGLLAAATFGRGVFEIATDDLPVLSVNAGLDLNEGAKLQITSSMLDATDDTQSDSATEIVYTLTSAPSFGTLALNGKALAAASSFTQDDINKGHVTYQHDGSDNLNDSFNFTATDGNSLASLASGFYITVNDLPTISVNAGLAVNEGQTAVFTSSILLTTDDSSSDPATELVYKVTGAPRHGTLTLNGANLGVGSTFTQDDVNHGRLRYKQDGTDNNDAFGFSLTDGNSLGFILGGVTITFNDLADLTVNPMTVGEGTTTPITTDQLLASDDTATDTPADLVYTITALPAHGGITLGGNPLPVGGIFTQQNVIDGLVAYVHDGSETISDNFSFTLTDGASLGSVAGQLNITIGDLADQIRNTGMSLPEGSTATLTNAMLLATEDSPDPATDLSYVITAAPAHGTLLLNGGALTVGNFFTQDDVNNGRVTYTQDGSDNNDSFSFALTDGGSPASRPGTFTITFQDLPTLNAPGLLVGDGTTTTITTQALQAQDDTTVDPDSELVFTLTSVPAHGTLLLGGTPLAVGNTFTQDDIDRGRLQYTQDGSETTADGFGFTVVDGTSPAALTGSLNITIGDIATPVTNTGMSLPEGTSAALTSGLLLYTDDQADPATDLVYRLTAAPGAGQLQLSGLKLGVGSTFTQDDINNGRVVYVHGGSDSNDSFTFTLTDGSSPESLTGTFVITFEDLPTLTVGGLTLPEGATATVGTQQLLATDDTAADPPTELVYTVTTAPAHGTLFLSGTPLTVGGTFTQDDVKKGRLTYMQDGNDTAGDGFSFTLVDGSSLASQSGTVNITIGDLATLATNTGLGLAEGSSGTVTSSQLLATDDSADPPTDLVYTLTTVPGHGTLLLSGKRLVAGNTFTQDDINNGRLTFLQDGSDHNDSFTFTVTDGSSPSSIGGTFAITFEDLPTLTAPGLIVAQGGSAPITAKQLLAADDTSTDPATDLVYTLTSLPAHGTLSLSGTPLAVGNTFTQDDVNKGRLIYAHDGSATIGDGFGITVTDGSSPSALSATFNITIAEPADHLILHIPSYALAGGTLTATVAAVAADGIVDPLYVGSVALALSSGPTGGSLGGVTVAAVQNGVASFPRLSLNAVGNYTVFAASTSDLLGSAANVTVGAPVHFLITGTPTATVAGMPFTVSVSALDSQNRPVVGYRGTVHFTSTDLQAGLPADYTFTAADAGTRSFAVTLKTAGKQAFSVADVTRTTAVSRSSVISVLPAAAASLAVTGYPTTAASGAAGVFTITALDAYGNRVPNYSGTVHFTSSDVQAVLPADYTFTAIDQGAHGFTATLKTLGDQSITASDAVNSLSGTESGIAVVSPATHLGVTGAPAGLSAGGSFTLTVTALDAANHTDAAFSDTIHFTSTDPHAVLPADYTFLPTDHGTQTFSITLETAGSQSVTVTDLVRPAIKGSTPATLVSPAAVSALSVTGFPNPDTSGAAHSFTVTAVDAYGNRISTYRGKVQFTSSDGQATLPAAYTFTAADKGAHVFAATLRTAGTASLTATDTATATISGTESGIQVLSTATHLAAIGVPASTTAGLPFTITVTALNTANQADTQFPDTIHFASSDHQASLPADYTFLPSDHGTKTFQITLGTAGPQTLTISDLTRPAIKAASAKASVTATFAAKFAVTGFLTPVLPGTVHSFTVTALDAYGNRTGLYRGQVQFTSSDGQAVLPGPYLFTAKDNGAHVFQATLKTLGMQSITALDPVNALSGSQTGINVTQLSGSISGPSVGVPGQPLAFTVTATENGQPANAVYRFLIDWNGTGKGLQTVIGQSGMTVLHAYPTVSNSITPRITIVDAVGNASSVASGSSITVQAVEIEADPANPAQTALAVGGVTGKNVIAITPADPTGTTVNVSINGVTQPGGPFAPTGHILVYGQGGNDTIQIVAQTINGQTVKVSVPAILYGGAGNNQLSAAGSSATNVLVGGAGNDSLTGGSGRDILIGGLGADVLRSVSGQDLLIGGSTAYDLNAAALSALAAEWGRTDLGYEGRVQDLFGRTSGGLNGSYLLDPRTVNADAVVNQLFGTGPSDWFWLTHRGKVIDKVGGYLDGEAATFE